MKLNFRTIGDGDPLIFLHGVFGSSDNWQSIGKEMSGNFQVYLTDLRNHGNSPHDDHFDYEVMATDVLEMIESEQITRPVILGHSMGGKTAMKVATAYPDLISSLIVVDIAPKHYPPRHQQIFDAFAAVPVTDLNSRKEADTAMSEIVPEFGVRQFLLKNLGRGSQGYFWKLNLEAIKRNIENIGQSLQNGEIYEGPTCFIRGRNSDYITDEDQTIIKRHFPNSNLITIEDAGHWVHADQPEKLIESLNDFLL